MCLFSDAELYCVSTNIRITSEFMQFDIGTSTRRYFPPRGTAGFDRSRVSGNRRLPAPPPRITASRLCLAGIGRGGYREAIKVSRVAFALSSGRVFPHPQSHAFR